MLRCRLDVNELLDIIIAEALVAQRQPNFEEQLRHIRLVVGVIERRIRNFWWLQYGSRIEQLMAKGMDEEEE